MKYYKMPRKYSTIRKFKGKCERCEKQISEKEAFCYVDGNNIAISYNSPYLCKQCYEKSYAYLIMKGEEEL